MHGNLSWVAKGNIYHLIAIFLTRAPAAVTLHSSFDQIGICIKIHFF